MITCYISDIHCYDVIKISCDDVSAFCGIANASCDIVSQDYQLFTILQEMFTISQEYKMFTISQQMFTISQEYKMFTISQQMFTILQES